MKKAKVQKLTDQYVSLTIAIAGEESKPWGVLLDNVKISALRTRRDIIAKKLRLLGVTGAIKSDRIIYGYIPKEIKK